MNPRNSQSTRNALIVLLAATAICMASSLFMMPYIPDDSYISFRYAENLTHGDGLTFNPGEPPVEAYSNLLWILFCALLFKLGFDLPSFMPFAGMVLAVANVALLWWILKRHEIPPLQMFFPLVMLGTSGPFIMYAISGLEAPLFALLLLAAMLLVDMVFETGKLTFYVALAVTCVLLSLARPEGVAVFPVIAASIFLLTLRSSDTSRFDKSKYKNLIISSAVFLLLIVVYNWWRISYFGEVLPTPFLSKGGGGKSIFAAWQMNTEIYFKVQGYYFPPLGWYFGALTLIGILGVVGLRSRRLRRRTEQIALIVSLFLIAVYFNFKDWMPGMRYHAVVVGTLLIPATHVLGPVFANGGRWSRGKKIRFWLSGIAVVCMSYSVLAELRIITSRTEESNQECLVKMSEWLREVMPPGVTLAMSDVGAVPYYTGFRTVDIHPESLTDLYIAKNGWSIDYFYKVRPEIVVIPSRSLFLTKFYPEHYGMVEDARFQDMYRFLGASRYDWYNDRCYWIFVPRRLKPFTREQMRSFPHGIGTIARKAR